MSVFVYLLINLVTLYFTASLRYTVWLNYMQLTLNQTPIFNPIVSTCS